MQFIIDNYIWFLAAGIIGLMTVIGYIAEKTDFGRKEIKRADSKETKVKKNVKKLEESKLKLNDVVYTETKDIEVIDVDKAKQQDEVSSDKLTAQQVEEDLTVPLNGKKEEPKEEINQIIEEDLTVPLNGDAKKNIAEVEETNKETKNVNPAEDIWKF